MVERPSIHALLGDALRGSADLARQEFALFRTEISNNIKSLFVGLALMMVAAVFAIASLIWLTQALVEWLAGIVHSEALAALIVGGGLAVLAVIFGWIGGSRIASASLAPKHTVSSVKRDAEVLQERVSG